MSEVIQIGLSPIQLENFKKVVHLKSKVELHPESAQKVRQCHDYLMSKVTSKEPIYGLNTGFGPLSDTRVDNKEIKNLQYHYLRSHAAGIGECIESTHVRGMLLLRAQSLAQGHSGVSEEIIQGLLNFLNHEIYPRVPCQGSVGASGDLAPLAHLALPLIGEGKVEYQGKVIDAKDALSQANLKPVELHGKSGLALNNGTQFMTSIAMNSLLEAHDLVALANLCSAISLEVIRGTRAAFDSDLHQVRPHPGQIKVAQSLYQWLSTNDEPSEIGKSHADCGRLQDPYSFRCIPQVHGASLDWIENATHTIQTEINSVTDNPIVFPKQDKIVSGGNFHGQYVAFACDQLSIALSELGNISERRTDKLTQPSFSGLKPFLTDQPGLYSGVMILQYAAAAIVSENKTLSHPASVDSIPTSIDKEDHVSMGAWGARKLNQIVSNLKKVLAIELFCGCQGIDLLRPLKSTPQIEKIHEAVRSKVPMLKEDRVLNQDIEKMVELIDDPNFRSQVRAI